jgi:hypothetical protein
MSNAARFLNLKEFTNLRVKAGVIKSFSIIMDSSTSGILFSSLQATTSTCLVVEQMQLRFIAVDACYFTKVTTC